MAVVESLNNCDREFYEKTFQVIKLTHDRPTPFHWIFIFYCLPRATTTKKRKRGRHTWYVIIIWPKCLNIRDTHFAFAIGFKSRGAAARPFQSLLAFTRQGTPATNKMAKDHLGGMFYLFIFKSHKWISYSQGTLNIKGSSSFTTHSVPSSLDFT